MIEKHDKLNEQLGTDTSSTSLRDKIKTTSSTNTTESEAAGSSQGDFEQEEEVIKIRNATEENE